MKELEIFRKFLNEDRGEFGQEEIDKLRDTIEAMGNDEAHQKALDMVTMVLTSQKKEQLLQLI